MRRFTPPLPSVVVPFALHTESKKQKGAMVFKENLKAFEPDEEQQRRGDGDSRTTADGAGLHRVRRRSSRSKEAMLQPICIINPHNKY